jgi:putative ABC transport system permease protein
LTVASLSTSSAASSAGTTTNTQSYLSVRAAQKTQVAVYAPFVVAFAIIGLVMSARYSTRRTTVSP